MAFIDMGDQFVALMAPRTQPPDVHRHVGIVVDDKEAVRAAAARRGDRGLATAVARSPGSVGQPHPGRRLPRDPVHEGTGGARERWALDGLRKTDAALAELRAKGIVIRGDDSRVDPLAELGQLDLGPLTIHMYGLTLLVAIALCTWVTGRRWVARGGDWDLIFRCAVWGVAAGIVGARLYHLATSWDEVPDEWWGLFAIWKGGLGVWGGIAAGCLVGGLIAKRAGADVWLLADCLAPGLLVAQAIGRLGNWWNQELFGKPTDLPWGLEIDPVNRPLASLDQATYHPAFLYELLWDFAAAAFLVFVIERRFRPRPPGLFAAYIALYCVRPVLDRAAARRPCARDRSASALNAWVALVGIVVGALWFVLSQRRGRLPRPRAARPTRRRRRCRARAEGASDRAASVAAWRRRSAISSWTSMLSRGRSISS